MEVIWQMDRLYLCKTGLEARAPISTKAGTFNKPNQKAEMLANVFNAVTELHMGAAVVKSALR